MAAGNSSQVDQCHTEIFPLEFYGLGLLKILLEDQCMAKSTCYYHPSPLAPDYSLVLRCSVYLTALWSWFGNSGPGERTEHEVILESHPDQTPLSIA